MFVLGGLRGGSSWRDVGVLGEVLAKTPIFYQVPNWSYGQKTKKRGEMGDGGFQDEVHEKYKIIT